jgi:hypothetical protein
MTKLGMAMLTETPTPTMVVTPRFQDGVKVRSAHGSNSVVAGQHQVLWLRSEFWED